MEKIIPELGIDPLKQITTNFLIDKDEIKEGVQEEKKKEIKILTGSMIV